MSDVGEPNLDEQVAALDPVPVVLLPVRVETRYIGSPDAPTELRIRVYPDQVHVDGHQPLLTEGELAAGQAYWRNRWTTGPGADERRAAAWVELTRGVRPTRAAHVVRTTAPTNAPPADPVFPAVTTRPAGIDAPLAMRGLPDRWLVVGYDDAGTVVVRKWFDHPVADGLLASAATDDSGPLPAEQVVDRYLGWTADYTQALAAGMGVTVLPGDVPNGNLSIGLTRLVVLGVRSGDGGADLAGLIAAHTVSDGLAFLRPGQPTNNLGGDGNDAAVAVVPSPVGVPDDPTLPPPAIDAEWSAGARLAAALGLPATTLAPVPGAGDTTAAVSSSVVAATWSATIGYFAGELLQPVVSDVTLAATREHAVRYLQPLGPLPTLRVGRQPLGVLPVVADVASFTTSAATDVFAAQLGGLLARLAPMWATAAQRVPTIRPVGDPTGSRTVDAALLAVLQRAPWTMRVRFRRVFGPLMGMSVTGLTRTQQLQGSLRSIGFLDALDLPAAPRIAPFVVRPEPRPLSVPIVGADLGFLARVRALTTDADGRTVLNQAADAASLFESLVTFSALQELDLSAARIGGKVLAGQPPATAASWRTPEILDTAQAATVSPRVLATTFQVPALGGRTLAQEVGHRQELPGPPDPDLAELAEFQSALAALETADPAVVDLAVRAQLDVCSHRLDAWQTSLASRQLEAVRAARGAATVLGGYGCVERLRPETTPDSAGYVTGPSLAHAATAGVLRSAHLANAVAGVDRLDVDLSSARTRLALELMRGVREGTPLTVLLGYRLERGLREADVALFILPLRTMFPIRAVPDPSPGTPREVTPPHDVVDALSLLDSWMHPTGIFFELPTAIARAAGLTVGDPRMTTLDAQLEVLADVFDAIGDLALAEAVHQTVAGRPERAQAAMRFLDRQEVPVEPDVTATPRRADAFVHRYAVAIGPPDLSTGWEELAADDPRSHAEPRIDSWVAHLLGDPGSWGFSGRPVAPGGSPGAIDVVTLADLGLGALALVTAAATGGGEHASELEQRVARVIAARHDAGSGVELLATTDDRLGLADVTALAGAVTRVLRTARPGDARTFDVPDGTVESGVDVAELTARATAAERRLRDAAHALVAAIDEPSPTVGALRDAIDDVSRAGVPGAVPAVGVLLGAAGDAAIADEVDAARGVVAAAQARLAQLDTIGAADPEASARRRIATVFGETFPVLGVVEVPADLSGVVSPGAQSVLTGGDPLSVATWLTRMSRVRSELDALWHLLVGAEATTGGFTATEHVIVQLPVRDGSRWAALPFAPDERPEGVAVATVVHTPGRAALSGSIAVLVVDAWTEQIPVAEETAGIALQYDAPSNRAPQVALLAVPPDIAAERPWSVDALLSVVGRSLDMAHARGVTLDELPAAGSVLPALYSPFDLGDDVPGIDLDRLVALHSAATLVMGKD